MSGLELSPEVTKLVNDLLVWIGFGTVVGLLAKAIMPGRDGGGPIATVLLGIAGSVLGCGCFGIFVDSGRIMPTSPLGMIVAVVGAFLLLAFYRTFADLLPWPALRPQRPSMAPGDDGEFIRRRFSSAQYED
jgi:uncharacterized membrane protein YeaQ/YmgE (transglycosylase-associated protein family)